jgi:hypothetical protein
MEVSEMAGKTSGGAPRMEVSVLVAVGDIVRASRSGIVIMGPADEEPADEERAYAEMAALLMLLEKHGHCAIGEIGRALYLSLVRVEDMGAVSERLRGVAEVISSFSEQAARLASEEAA